MNAVISCRTRPIMGGEVLSCKHEKFLYLYSCSALSYLLSLCPITPSKVTDKNPLIGYQPNYTRLEIAYPVGELDTISLSCIQDCWSSWKVGRSIGWRTRFIINGYRAARRPKGTISAGQSGLLRRAQYLHYAERYCCSSEFYGSHGDREGGFLLHMHRHVLCGSICRLMLSYSSHRGTTITMLE